VLASSTRLFSLAPLHLGETGPLYLVNDHDGDAVREACDCAPEQFQSVEQYRLGDGELVVEQRFDVAEQQNPNHAVALRSGEIYGGNPSRRGNSTQVTPFSELFHADSFELRDDGRSSASPSDLVCRRPLLLSVAREPTLPSLAQLYIRGIRRVLGDYYAAWLPNEVLRLGDVGVLRANQFRRVTSLQAFGVKFDARVDRSPTELDFSSGSDVHLVSKAAGELNEKLPGIPVARAGIGVQFDHAGGFVLKAPATYEHSIENIDQVQERILALFEQGRWKRDWAVIVKLVQAPSASILVAKSSGSSVELEAVGDVESGAVTLGDADVRFELRRRVGDVIALPNARDISPLFQLMGVRRRMLRGVVPELLGATASGHFGHREEETDSWQLVRLMEPLPERNVRSLTVEFQRFGESTGILRPSERYIRIPGPTAPATEVAFPISQERILFALDALDYSRIRQNPEASRKTAEGVIRDLGPYAGEFLGAESEPGDAPEDELLQVDVVTHALELAQLPFEVLEEVSDRVVITRRIRQPWPPPEVARSLEPRLLFAWAEPIHPKRRGLVLRVPHDEHRSALEQVLEDIGRGELVELAHATRDGLAARVREAAREGRPFTHVHLLVHGMAETPKPASGSHIELVPAETPPSNFLALEADSEKHAIHRCAPDELSEVFVGLPRPEALTLATCHSAEIDPVLSGGTVAHALHQAGIPIVVASQFALTKHGSRELVETFLRGVLEGQDPRVALWKCRRTLRESSRTTDPGEQTYFDRIALVGYFHLDEAIEARCTARGFQVALARLKHASREADERAKELQQVEPQRSERLAESERILAQFENVRRGLSAREETTELSKAELAELRGLQASAFKREAEALFGIARAFGGNDHERSWLERSHRALADASEAYELARMSLDDHWVSVQWLVLEAVMWGSLEKRGEDWVVAQQAALRAAERSEHLIPDVDVDTVRHAGSSAAPAVGSAAAAGSTADADATADAATTPDADAIPPADEIADADAIAARDAKERAKQRAWGFGSLAELYLLAPLLPHGLTAHSSPDRSLTRAIECLDQMVEWSRSAKNTYPIQSTLDQLARYEDWWGRDAHWALPAAIVERARRLRAHLHERSKA